MRAMSIAARWPDDCGDTCGNVFGQALKACDPDIEPTARVFEVGCAEFNWITKAKQAWPDMTFTGIDWRPSANLGDGERIQGDVMTYVSKTPFDWIVSISAIEHVGLGHYEADPVNERGDSLAIERAYHSLRPGGWMYFDVPWNVGEDAYHVVDTSHRIYDDATIVSRLIGAWSLDVVWRGVYRQKGQFVEAPERLPEQGFYYLALWLRKRIY